MSDSNNVNDIPVEEGAAEPQEVCEWKYFFTSFYGTSCNNFDMMMGKYKFCPYCGKPIKEVF